MVPTRFTAAEGTRVLLVDNYSSFTFNLYQYLAELTGVLPRVVPNDSEEELSLEEFDAVVLSPGPGTPREERDFGICRAMLAQEKVAVLGVCLGHQGLGVQAGAKLSPSAQPWHGRPSTIVHEGGPLFAGIPARFRAIRYHSLVLHDPLPDSLECIARTDDGQVMALRHRTRPHWGVQFHPESFETEYGKELLANFCALSGRKNRAAASMAPAARAPRPARQTWRMETHRLDEAPAAEELFARLFGAAEASFWLDGASAQGFSFMGDSRGPRSTLLRYQQETGTARFSGARDEVIHCDSIFSLLEEELATHEVQDAGGHPFSFVGGFVGYFGYELKKEVGASHQHRSHLPDAHWIWADRFVAYDHDTEVATLVALVPAGGSAAEAGAESREWFDEVHRLLEKPWQAPPKRDCESEVAPVLRDSHDSYEAKIRECQERIAVGESYELCLTTHYQAELDVDAWELFRIMRAQNPAPYSAFLRCSDFSIVSASPERFLRIDAQGMAESKPIKGTASRDSRAEVDRQLAQSLLTSEKERAENLMIVDLVRNDLGRNCEVGSVVVDEFAALESFATVHQLVSTIRGRLRPEVSSLQCVRDAFPGGSMTGAPKLRSMEILDRLEEAARGPYSGSIGYLGCDGAVDLSIVIRSVVVEADRVSLGVGGAITALSDSELEFHEMQLKARAQITALRTLCSQALCV